MIRFLFRRFVCWAVFGHDLRFVRNIHGDEIFAVNGNRSWWSCTRCDALVTRPELLIRGNQR